MKICINAGHGPKGVNNSSSNGIDPGAIGPSGYKEYIETKEIADLVSTKLKFNGIETLVIQDGDLYDVINKSNSWKSDYFVSIHTNSFSVDSHGVETFSLASTGKGRMLAESVHKELVPATGLYDRSLKTANYYVLRETDCPAILTEIGFISNPKEEALMKDFAWDDRVSSAIARGICNFLGLAYKEQPTIQPTINNNQGSEFKMETCVVYFSPADFSAALILSNLNKSCAMFCRNASPNVHPDALKATKIITVGGPKLNVNGEIYLSGNGASDTLIAVGKYLQGN